MARLNRFWGAICLAPIFFCSAADAYYLSEAEQDKITAVVLKYVLEQGDYVPSRNSELYLSVRGEDPTPRLMAEIKGLSATFKPESASKLFDGTVSAHISINAFVPKGPATAVTNMSIKCQHWCSPSGQIWVKKAKGGWSVAVISDRVIQ